MDVRDLKSQKTLRELKDFFLSQIDSEFIIFPPNDGWTLELAKESYPSINLYQCLSILWFILKEDIERILVFELCVSTGTANGFHRDIFWEIKYFAPIKLDNAM